MIRLFVVYTLLLFLTAGCTSAYLEVDTEQGRLAQAAPVIGGGTTVGQTFVAQHDRLRAVEVMLVVYEAHAAAQADGELVFHLRAVPDAERDLATRAFPLRDLAHNQTLRVDFEPLSDSAGRSYYFYFDAPADSHVSVWQYPLDVYRGGAAQVGGAPRPGDLRFVTYYGYTLLRALRDIARSIRTHAGLVLPLLGLLIVPGYTLLLLVQDPSEAADPVMQMALATGLSVALWPLILLLTTLLGVSLTPLGLAVLLVLLAAVGLMRAWQLDWQPLAAWRDRRGWPALAAFAALLALTAALRMLQARNLVVPAWVDGVHHTMITQLIIARGRVPTDYQPFMDSGPFIYHYGFHSLAAALAWLADLSAPQAVLITGQVVNALVGVGVYALTAALVDPVPARGERRVVTPVAAAAGLLAMGSVGLISFMPAYYVTWGRYTQLAGLLVLPTAVVLTLWWLDTGRRWMLLAAAIAVAGLTLVHYRVLVFYAALVIAYLVYRLAHLAASVVGARRVPALAPLAPVAAYVRRTVVLAGLSLLLLTPWLARLAAAFTADGGTADWLGGSPAANALPRGLIDIGYDRVLLRAALLSLLLGLLWWSRVAVVLGVAAGVAVLVTNPQWLGYHTTWLFNNTALVITLFLPVAVLTAVMVVRAAAAVLGAAPAVVRRPAVAVLAGIVLAAMFAGAWRNVDIVNPVTVIATEADVDAMVWIQAQTAPDAGFLTSVREWQHDTYMGADGGYWIPLLTGRRTLVPPALYTFGLPDYYYAVQDRLDRLAGVVQADDPALTDLMAQYGLEYVYIGAKGSPFDLQSFVNAPDFDVAYSNGAAWVFRLRHGEVAATN